MGDIRVEAFELVDHEADVLSEIGNDPLVESHTVDSRSRVTRHVRLAHQRAKLVERGHLGNPPVGEHHRGGGVRQIDPRHHEPVRDEVLDEKRRRLPEPAGAAEHQDHREAPGAGDRGAVDRIGPDAPQVAEDEAGQPEQPGERGDHLVGVREVLASPGGVAFGGIPELDHQLPRRLEVGTE